MAVFYTYEKNHEKEKMDFLRMLYHNKRGGQMIRLRKDGNQVSQLSTCDMDELAATGTDFVDYFTTVHTFRGYKRTSDRVFNIGSIYIDLDCHTEELEQIQVAKQRTVEILEAAFSDGLLDVPTMITDTGRGFGLQYVLVRSIANVWKTYKIQAFYKKVQKSLYEKYQEILSVDPQAAQPDATVLDDARVCRIPGTYNTAADTYCRLISMSGKCYELSDIVQGCHLWDWKTDEEYKKNQKKTQVPNGKVVSFTEYTMPFLRARLEQLTKLQELRGADCEGYREQMLFIAYSALVQLDRESATMHLKKINNGFLDPLDQAELDHIVEETDSSVGYDHRGYYKLKNEYLIERLNLSDEEIRYIGLGMGGKRTSERQAAREKKEEKRKKIVELLKQADILTYDEIAVAVGVSKRKICMIAKNEGLMRYAKAANRQQKNEDKTKKVAEVISIDTVRKDNEKKNKSAKNATESVCVCAFDFDVSVSCWIDWLEHVAVSQCEQQQHVAQELLALYKWSSWDNLAFGLTIHTYFDCMMPSIMRYPGRLARFRDNIAQKFFDFYGLEACAYLFGVFDLCRLMPTLWTLFKSRSNKIRRDKKT